MRHLHVTGSFLGKTGNASSVSLSPECACLLLFYNSNLHCCASRTFKIGQDTRREDRRTEGVDSLRILPDPQRCQSKSMKNHLKILELFRPPWKFQPYFGTIRRHSKITETARGGYLCGQSNVYYYCIN